MNCLIVTNPYAATSSLKEKALRLEEELHARGISFKTLDTSYLTLILNDSEATFREELKSFDFGLYLDKDKYIGRAIERIFPLFNSAQATEICDDKTLTYMALLGSHIRTPKTIPAPLCYSQPLAEPMQRFLDTVERELGYPLVCKEAYGSLGKQVYLVRDRAELESTYLRLAHVTHLYQKFIGTRIDHGEDFRVITIGGKTVASMKRINDGDFRSNLGCGGHAIKVDHLPEEVSAMAERVSRLLKVDYAGVDIALDCEGLPTLLEVNSNAFFKGIESTSGVDVAGQLVDWCLHSLNAVKK